MAKFHMNIREFKIELQITSRVTSGRDAVLVQVKCLQQIKDLLGLKSGQVFDTSYFCDPSFWTIYIN